MDYQLFQFVNQIARINDVLDYFIIFCAKILIVFLVFGVVSLAIVRAKEWGKEMFFDATIGMFTALFISWIVPLLYVRPRPFVDHSVHQLVLIDPSIKSFPSDHTLLSFAVAMAVWQYDRKWGSIFFVLAALVGLSRVAAGVHYPFDIVAGAVIGVVASLFVKRFLDSLLRKPPTAPQKFTRSKSADL